MSRRQKIAVAVGFALIVLLYLAAVGNGAGRGQGDANGAHGGFIDWLGSLAGQPAAVDPAGLSGACLSGRVLTVHSSCAVGVPAGGKGLRRLRLRARDAASVSSRAPERDSVVRVDVKAGDQISVTVDKRGGDVTVDCADGGTCVLDLV